MMCVFVRCDVGVADFGVHLVVVSYGVGVAADVADISVVCCCCRCYEYCSY